MLNLLRCWEALRPPSDIDELLAPRLSSWVERSRRTHPRPSTLQNGHPMNCTIRRYESIDQSRKSELVKKVDESLLPKLSELPGFTGYSLTDAGDGVITSVGFFDTAAQADESTRIAAGWLREQKLEKALPNAPKLTSG